MLQAQKFAGTLHSDEIRQFRGVRGRGVRGQNPPRSRGVELSSSAVLALHASPNLFFL